MAKDAGSPSSIFRRWGARPPSPGLPAAGRQSGKGRGVFFRVACNRRLRYAITWYAYASLRQCEWARAYYDHQRARGHGHYQALRALGAKWLKILFVVRRDRVPYDETRHLANIARQNLRQALFS